MHTPIARRVLLIASLRQRHSSVSGAQPESVAVRLHPVVFELLGLGSEHIGKVPKGHARGDVAGGDKELGARVIPFGEPGVVSASLRGDNLTGEKALSHQRLMLRDVMGGEVRNMRRHECARGKSQGNSRGSRSCSRGSEAIDG